MDQKIPSSELFNRDFTVGFVAKAEMPIKIGTLGVFFPQT
jgi:hypothetical protein